MGISPKAKNFGGNFAEGENFWRKILLGRGGYPPPLLEILVIKGEYSKIAVIKDLWSDHCWDQFL